MHYRSLLRLDVLLAALESFLIFAYSYINMSTNRELDTPSLTAVSEQDESQRSSVITSAETNSVLLATMQEMLKCIADLTKKVDQRQHGPDDEPIDESLLDDEFNEGEPASKRPCLDASVSKCYRPRGPTLVPIVVKWKQLKLLRLRRPQVRFSTGPLCPSCT